MPKPARTLHYVCKGGCGGVSDDPKATCQAKGCPLHGHPLTPCSCKDGKHSKVLASVKDIKKLQVSLREERDRVNLIISSMGEGLLVVDRDGKITMINPAAEKLLEISSKDAQGRNWAEIVSTLKEVAKTPTKERSFARSLDTGEVIIRHLDDNHYYLTRSGRRFPIVSITAPIKSNGEIIGAVKVFRDATPEKEAKRAVEQKVEERTRELKEEKARLLASIENLPLGFFMIDTDHNILLMNPAMKEILNSDHKLWTFSTLTKKFGEANIDFIKLCAHCRENRSLFSQDNISFGNKIIRIISVPIAVKESQEIIGSAVLVEDVTEAKLLERTKDEFFSIASHELRTPLTAIRGNASLVKQYFGDKLGDPDLKEMIEDMYESSVRLIDIVSDFLDVSRLEQGKIEFNLEEFDLYKAVVESIHDVEQSAEEKSLYIKLEDPPQELPKVFADRGRTKQVLLNLIGNAVKFTQAGGVRIELTPGEGFLKVWIKDTGIGIPKENQKLLFRKFQQAQEKILTRDVTRGTGLGLYISKLMVEGMGGEIMLERTERGKGSTFSFTLPSAKRQDSLIAKKKRGG